MQFLKALLSHMGIYLGAGQIAVAKQHLHDTQVGPMIEQMGREGVAQGMRGQMFVNAGLGCATLDQMPKGLPGHRRTAVGDEQVVAHA